MSKIQKFLATPKIKVVMLKKNNILQWYKELQSQQGEDVWLQKRDTVCPSPQLTLCQIWWDHVTASTARDRFCQGSPVPIIPAPTLVFTSLLAIFTGNITDHEVKFSYSERFYGNIITIIFNISHENPLILFTVNISVAQMLPATVLEGLHSPITSTLPLFYNTEYNISVVASFCRHIIATSSVNIFYGMYNHE